MLSHTDLEHIAQYATDVVHSAAAIIRQRLGDHGQVQYKPGATTLANSIVTEVDQQVQHHILQRLQPILVQYDLGLLAEESQDNGSRFKKHAFLTLDPIDGTLAFSRQQPGYAIAIAVVSRAGESLLGIIHDPCQRITWQSIHNRSASRQNIAYKRNVPELSGNPLYLHVDDSLLTSPQWSVVQQTLQHWMRCKKMTRLHIVTGAGSVIQACSVIDAKQPSLYIKPPRKTPGGGHIWDIAATVSLATQVGTTAIDFNHNPLQTSGILNRPNGTQLNQNGICFANHPALATAAIQKWQEICG